MDNVTHTLAGLLMAESAVQLRSRGGAKLAPSWRTTAYIACTAGNNLPDVDFLYAGITPRPLGYLLHHRGHSHTVVAALAFALLSIGVIAAIARWQRLAWSKSDGIWIAGLCVLSPLVHIAMDFSNNYGVHPFWPFYDGWIYGDAVFIIEPFFWATAIPPLLFAARWAGTRFILGAVLLLGLGLCWFLPFIPFVLALALTLLAAGMTFASWRSGAARRIAVGVGASWAVAVMFFAASRVAKSTARSAASDLAIADVVATPLPANPFCFNVLVVGRRGADYVVVRSTVSTLPSFMPSERCPRDPDDHPTAPFVRVATDSTPAILYRGEIALPIAELDELARDNCEASAFLRFARVPYVVREIADRTIIGDVRYDRHAGLDFADIRLASPPGRCPPAVPPWLAPRRDLLQTN